MKALVLGTAAGGGLPQWNCACAQCARARRDGAHRTQDCLAVSANGERWYLVNASPDIRAQLLAAPRLAPGPGRRETPIAGVLFTDAELDHTIGLLALREDTRLDIYATDPVLRALDGAFPVRRVLDPYGAKTWHTVTAGAAVALDGDLRVTAVPLGAKRPRYTERDRPGARPDWVVAYRFEDGATGGCLVYAPCVADWAEPLDGALAGARCALLDGTFFHDDEMTRATGSGRTATAMGHLPIGETLPRLAGRPGLRVLYTHLNNTNPVLDPGSAERAAVTAAGAEIPADGQLIEL